MRKLPRVEREALSEWWAEMALVYGAPGLAAALQSLYPDARRRDLLGAQAASASRAHSLLIPMPSGEPVRSG